MLTQFLLVGPRVKWFFVSSVGVILLCLLGDYLLQEWDSLCDLFHFVHDPLIKAGSKALMDNLVHAIVAGWCWLNAWLLDRTEKWSRVIALQVLCCTVLGSLLDLDHFIQAGSLNIHDAVHLSHRPFLHNTTLILVLTMLLFIFVYLLSHYGVCPSWLDYDLPAAMFLVACLSHQLRDSTRRGVWLPPLGTLPPRKLYLLVIILLPLVVVTLRQCCKQLPLINKHVLSTVQVL